MSYDDKTKVIGGGPDLDETQVIGGSDFDETQMMDGSDLDATQVIGRADDLDHTKVIGSDELNEEFFEEFDDFNHAYDENNRAPEPDTVPEPEIDELAYIEEERERERALRQARLERARQAEELEQAKKPKKKKSKKGLVIAIIVLLLAAAGGAAYAVMNMDRSQDLQVDLATTMTEPDVTGYQGEGTLGEITVKTDAVDDIIRDLESDEQKTMVASFFESVEYTVDKSSELSEGDVITITAKYDQTLADEASITVTNAETTYTVGKLKEKPVEEETTESAINMPQWYRHISETEGELAVTCLLIADVGTSVTLPIEFMYCYAGGPMSEMVDTSQAPNLTYNGTGYYMEDGAEAPTGTVTEVDDSHIKYAVKQYGDSYTITVNYTVGSDGSLNVTSASGGEVQAPAGTYAAISSAEASDLGGSN